jgi:16S rRNA (guanine527-N7)-methyltransferase
MMTERKLPPSDEFDKVLAARAGDYGVRLADHDRAALRSYFELVMAWNYRLHLVAPCAPSEFATRHVLESLVALRFLTHGATLVDVGSGAGLPALPCLVVRPDLRATLVEASRKKAVFLREAVSRLDLRGRVEVVAERFERLDSPIADFLTCRAIERFAEVLPEMLAWAEKTGTLLLFAGEALGERIESAGLPHERITLPDSERRFLFVVRRK